MHSQLIVLPLSTLSKQNPRISLCCRPQWRLQAAPRCSISFHSIHRWHRHEGPIQCIKYRRQFHTQHERPIYHDPLLLSTSSAKLESRQQNSSQGLPNNTGRAKQGQSHRKQIAVLGGGISGLSSAYYLTREFPSAQITIYEGSNRLGGWINTQVVDVGDDKIIFEQGPRTLQPQRLSSLVTLDLVR